MLEQGWDDFDSRLYRREEEGDMQFIPLGLNRFEVESDKAPKTTKDNPCEFFPTFGVLGESQSLSFLQEA